MPPAYEHTQKSPLHLLIWCTGVVIAVIGVMADDTFGALVCCLVATLVVPIALMFMKMTVRDEGEYLAVRYGPLPVFKAQVRLYRNQSRRRRKIHHPGRLGHPLPSRSRLDVQPLGIPLREDDCQGKDGTDWLRRSNATCCFPQSQDRRMRPMRRNDLYQIDAADNQPWRAAIFTGRRIGCWSAF